MNMNAQGITSINHNVSHILQDLALNAPHRPAIIDYHGGTRTATFLQLEEEVDTTAEILRQQGVKPLDIVLILVPLKRELISLLLAVFRIGAQALFIDPGYSFSKILHCLKLARPNVLIFDPRLKALAVVAPVFGMGKTINSQVIFAENASGAAKQNVVAVPKDHPALITFTSGSTGMPKGILRSHGFLVEQAKLLRRTLPPDANAEFMQVLTTLPMFILSTLAAGDTAIIAANDDRALLGQLKYLAPNRILCAPNSLLQICDLITRNSVLNVSIKEVVVGGGPVFPELLTDLNAAMPGVILTTVYGSTEAEPICHRQYCPGDRIIARHGLPLGKQIDGVELRIIDSTVLNNRQNKQTEKAQPPELSAECFAGISLPRNCEGEIVVSGAHIIKGYLAGYGDCETKFCVDGVTYHRTGDAGFIDESGELILTGRISAGVKLSGRRIYPLTVELVAMANHGVEKCAFVEVRDKGVLALTLRSKDEQSTVLPQLKSAFASANISVDKFVVLDKLPMDERHHSKVVYAKLRHRLRLLA
ncbi:MAG: acyl--CoA ligase [Cyanobacteria bacterium SZAS LIN-3]|nr:acyl--CoA ligase [Cyanobacteria bacterium SZAS LIN-3]